jgi:hypothetical protein
MATTYTQKLRASIAYNTDQYQLECDCLPAGVQPLMIKTSILANAAFQQVVSIALNDAGALVFYMGPRCWEYTPSETNCRIALEWINTNFDKLFPED